MELTQKATFTPYYVVIPAYIRYDEDLSPNAKLLYADISAVCKEKGYCTLNNNHFAELYGCTKQSVSSWISELKRKGYVYSEMAENSTRVLLADFCKGVVGNE